MKTTLQKANLFRILYNLIAGESPVAVLSRVLVGRDNEPLIDGELLRQGNAAHKTAVLALLGITATGATIVKVTVANQTARYLLTTATVQNGDYVYQTDTGILYEVIDQTALNGSTGYVALATVTAAQISDASANGRSLIAADYAAMKVLLALTIGTNVQAWNAKLDTYATTKIYRALLTQSGTDAPTVTVLENTLGGTVVWTYDSQGNYIATLAAAFPSSKVFVLVGQADASGNHVGAVRNGNDEIVVATTDSAGAPANNVLGGHSLELIVYP